MYLFSYSYIYIHIYKIFQTHQDIFFSRDANSWAGYLLASKLRNCMMGRQDTHQEYKFGIASCHMGPLLVPLGCVKYTMIGPYHLANLCWSL